MKNIEFVVVCLTASLLVGAVAAVRVVVAHPGQGDALPFPRPAGELLRRTRLLLCVRQPHTPKR